MRWLVGGLIYLFTGNPFIAIGSVLLVLWLLDSQARGHYFNPWRGLRELQQIHHLKGVLLENPHDRPAHLERGRLLLKYHRSAQALPHLERAEGPKGSAEAAWLLGRALLAQGQLEPAKQALERCWRARGQAAFAGEPLVDLGAYLVSKESYVQATAVLVQGVAANSSSAQALYYLGAAQAGAGQAKLAHDSFSLAILRSGQGPRFKRRENRPWAWRARVARLLL